MTLSNYRIKKYVTRNGVIYYIVQRRFLWVFWRGIFRSRSNRGGDIDFFSTPRIYWSESEAIADLKSLIKENRSRKESLEKALKEIKNNRVIYFNSGQIKSE